MQVHVKRVTVEPGQRHWLFLCSDLHLGSPQSDVKRLKADLDMARAAGARVIINGDVYDGIDCRDKRWTPDAVVPELRSSRTLTHDVVKYGAAILEPYADIIDVIGIGNHEEKWINWNAVDPVTLTLELLNASLEKKGSDHRIRHGGFCGYYRTVLKMESLDTQVSHTLFYWHGTGGDSPVTKGLIDFNRKAVHFLCDAMTCGHNHHRNFDDSEVVSLSARGHVRFTERKAIRTGSYYQNYAQGKQSKPCSYSYATSKMHSPKPRGGMFLCLSAERERRERAGGEVDSSLWRVRQSVHEEFPG